jgi:hypothetical protein
MRYVLYRYCKGIPTRAAVFNASTYKDVTGVSAVRRYSESSTAVSISGLDNYVTVLPLHDLQLFRRNGFVTGLELIECITLKEACKSIGFNLTDKTFK